MRDGEGLTEEHLCSIPGSGQQCRVNLGRDEGGTGWRWEKGEKVGTTVRV